jgi:exodeoxyribonuclease VII large subunit
MSLDTYMQDLPAPEATLGSVSRVWGVRALCLAVADQLQARFNPVVVRGEISGLSRAASGHCYFSLQDESGAALLRCAMFKRAAGLLDFTLRNGLQVQVKGRIGVYEARGDLQLVIESAQLAGEGALMERFMALKAKLTEQGLFDAERKKTITRSPRRIGIVTSLGAAALHDVCTALSRRVPHIPVRIAPALVQGAGAVAQLVNALETMQRQEEAVDVILLVRGGGSLEDLWAFNEEPLVRAVADSTIPIICGVGHETDFTLCDFAADLRAPTPTAAAELCATAFSEWMGAYTYFAQQVPAALLSRLNKMGQELDYIASSLKKPSHFVTQRQGVLGLAAQRLEATRQNYFTHKHNALDIVAARLQALSPQRTLERGYALLMDAQGEVLSRADQLQSGHDIYAQMQDAKIRLSVPT